MLPYPRLGKLIIAMPWPEVIPWRRCADSCADRRACLAAPARRFASRVRPMSRNPALTCLPECTTNLKHTE